MKLTDGFDLIDPASYAANGPPHESWTALRRHSPVHRCEPRDYPPFWAITRHAHICEISKQPDKFLNQTGITHQRTHETIDRSEGIGAMRTIIEMDPPEHRGFRKVASPWFTPRALDRIDAAVQASARALVDGLAGRTGAGECDFARDVATAHPLRILSTILGVPRAEEPRILRLTNQIFAFEDTELQRPGESREQAIRELGLELYQLFAGIIEDRRRNPRDDLATVLANGRVNGEPMGPLETFGYYLITFTAGHDTTKNALAGGMHALIQNPDELAKLRRDPGLVKPAVEEVVRWASPVNYMRRRAARHTEVGGQRIRQGRLADPLLRLGQPRRGRLRRSLLLPRRPRSEPPRGLRARRALLSRLAPGAPLATRALRRARAAPRARRARGRARVDPVELRRRPEAPADPLPHRARRVMEPAPTSLEEAWPLGTP